MPATVRRVSCEVTFAGVELTNVIGARGQLFADSGWQSCSVFVTAKPPTGNEEDDIEVVAGAGNNVTRFTGKVRQFRSSAFPKAIEMVCMGTLGYADEWAPVEDMAYDPDVGEFTSDFVADELPYMFGLTDQELIRAVLAQLTRVTIDAGDIDGRGVVLGNAAGEAFVWRAGITAWSYIQQLDRATLYRTYQTNDGTIRRVKMIGHPSSRTPDFTLTPIDILEGSSGNRDTTRTRNAVSVIGHDPGDGAGPRTNADGTYGANDFQGSGDDPAHRYLETFSSPLIESGTFEDGTVDGTDGLNARDIAEEILPDVNKEFVEANVLSWRDDTHGPGLTCLLDCLNRLAIGEPMWVAGYQWDVGDTGWRATYRMTGGGLPQDYEPPPV